MKQARNFLSAVLCATLLAGTYTPSAAALAADEPPAVTDEETVDTVTFGEIEDSDLTWKIEQDPSDGLYVLTIEGEGAMPSKFNSTSTWPWEDRKGDIKTVEIETGVTTVGDSAFAGCTNLSTVELPDSVTSIGNSAFEGCTHLNLEELPEEITSIGSGAFMDCNNIALQKLPDGVTIIYDSAFSNCQQLALKKLPNGIIGIGNSAFTSCENLALEELPDTLTYIGISAFSGCTKLALKTLPDQLTSIAGYAFSDCTGLKELTLPNGIGAIGSGAFTGCKNLEMLTFTSKQPPQLGNNAFTGCEKLTTIHLPNALNGYEEFKENFSNATIEFSYAISTDTITSLEIGSVEYGSTMSEKIVTVTNNGTESVTIDEPIVTSENLTLGTLSTTTLAPGEKVSFTVQPKADLLPGAYSDVITLQGKNGENSTNIISISVTFTVIEPQADITISASPAEGGTVTGGETVNEGTAVTLTATPNSGYHFVRWEENGTAVSTDATYTFTATSDCTLTAIFEKDNTGGSGGGTITPPAPPTYKPTISESEGGTVNVTPKRPEKGDEVTITPEPEEGYEVDKVIVTDKNGNELDITKNDDGTYTFTQPSGRVTITVTYKKIEEPEPTPSVSDIFIDVAPDAWYVDAVQFAYDEGIMTGTSDTTFSPELTTTRGMIVAILHRLEGSPTVSDGRFNDVADGDWYDDAVNWAASKGIVNGTSATTFAPNAPITREQLAAILYNYAEYKGIDTSARADLSDYSDAESVSDWAEDVLSWAVDEGLVNGMTDTTLVPQGNATRAQVAAISQRFLSK